MDILEVRNSNPGKTIKPDEKSSPGRPGGDGNVKEMRANKLFHKRFYGEFDPGSGRTLAACLTHASRTES